MMERPGSITGQDEEHWRSRHRDQIQRQQDNELEDLPQRKWRVNSARDGLAEPSCRVLFIWVQDPGTCDQCLVAFIHKHRVEHVHQSFIDEKSLEERLHNGSSLAQDQNSSVEPRSGSLEDREECNLREVCEEEEQRVYEGGEKYYREQPSAKERPQEAM